MAALPGAMNFPNLSSAANTMDLAGQAANVFFAAAQKKEELSIGELILEGGMGMMMCGMLDGKKNTCMWVSEKGGFFCATLRNIGILVVGF